MDDSFTIGYWLSEGITNTPDAAIELLRSRFLSGSSTITAEFDPSSNVTRFMPARFRIRSPTSALPVNVTMLTRESKTSRSPTAPPGPVITFSAPAGNPHSSKIRAIRIALIGVAELTDREVVIYDNPRTTKTLMSADLLAEIVAQSPNINHIKVTDPDLSKISRLRGTSDAILLAGSDEVMHHQVVRGCQGAVTAAPQVFPRACRAWFDAAMNGDQGRALYDRLLPFVIELLLGPDQYPAVVKYALFRLGVLTSDEVLSPLTPLDEQRRRELAEVLEIHAFEETL